MLLEIHSHTNRHSKCSRIDPVTLVRKTVKKGLQGLIITEHEYLWSEEELAALRSEAGIDKGFVILAGQEADTDAGHVLVFGAPKSIVGKIKLDALRKLYPKAALVLAHPFRKNVIPAEELLLSKSLDAVEIFSLNHSIKENYRGLKSWHELKFTATSGSDTHCEANAGELPTQFDHEIKNIDDAAREIKEGRVRPFFKEIPKSGSDLTVTEITLGTKGDDELRQRIIIKSIPDNAKWEKAKASAILLQKIGHAGFNQQAFRVPRVLDINQRDHTIIEESQRGKNLFDLLSTVSPETGIVYFEMAAKWMAKFHAMDIKSGIITDILEKENKRLLSYENNFLNTDNSHFSQVKHLIDSVKNSENEIFKGEKKNFVLNHGDYHPKNIIIGQDKMQDPSTLFISVIDFANSFDFVPAFDVGYFLAQFTSQFAAYPAILKRYTEDIFLKAYLGQAKTAPSKFLAQISLFKIRANLSIANHFIKVGKGESAELHKLITNSTTLMKNLASSGKL